MTPYLLRSGVLHAAATAFLFAFINLGRPAGRVYYTIDFLGGLPGEPPGGGGASGAPAAPAAPAKRPAAAVETPEPLPPLNRWRAKAKAATLRDAEMAVKSQRTDAPPAVEAGGVMGASRKEAAPAGSPGAGAGTRASVTADLSAFPYPWYLARLRDALWLQWSTRLPGTSDACVVSFVVSRGGQASDLAVSETSGDSTFDYAALSAVRAAAPFPPLPEGYRDPTLKVHVRFETP